MSSDTIEYLSLAPDVDVDFAAVRLEPASGLPTPVVVSLLRRPDRWAAAQASLAACQVGTPIKAAAVDGRALSMKGLAHLFATRPEGIDDAPEHYLHMTRPATGCFLSHLGIWKRFLQSDAPFALIMEDDVVPSPTFTPQRAADVMRALPPDADMVLLGGTIMDGLAEPSMHEGFTRVYYYNGTYAYLLTRKGCRALLPHLLPIKTHIDNQISRALVDNRSTLTAYCVEPRLFDHDFSVYSDVYIPVADTATADQRLDVIFKDSRSRLLQDGARLLPTYGS